MTTVKISALPPAASVALTDVLPMDVGGVPTTKKATVSQLLTTVPPNTRNVIAGAGMTGGGDLSADRTFNVVANVDGSIAVNADDIQVGVLATDAQHGVRGGGNLHADVVAAGASGFMTGADKTKLDGLPASPVSSVTGTAPIVSSGGTTPALSITAASGANAGSMSAADKTKLDGLPASAVPTTRVLTAGAGMTGGGDLSADRTFNVVANADGSMVVNADDIKVGVLATDAQHGVRGGGNLHADVVAAGASGFMTGADKTKLDGIQVKARTCLLTWGTLTGIQTSTTTRFLDPGYNQAQAGTTTVPWAAPSAGNIKNLRVAQLAGAGGAVLYTLTVNGVATALSASVLASATSGSDLADTIPVAAGDLIALQVTKAAGIGTSPTRIVVSAEMTA